MIPSGSWPRNNINKHIFCKCLGYENQGRSYTASFTSSVSLLNISLNQQVINSCATEPIRNGINRVPSLSIFVITRNNIMQISIELLRNCINIILLKNSSVLSTNSMQTLWRSTHPISSDFIARELSNNFILVIRLLSNLNWAVKWVVIAKYKVSKPIVVVPIT